MDVWEYRIEEITKDRNDMVSRLQKLGTEGWEWAEILSQNYAWDGPGSRLVLFKRRIAATSRT